MDQLTKDFLELHRLAVVGASRSGGKIGNAIVENLAEKGYEVYPVHPSAKEIQGRVCHPDLASVKELVDGVVICIPPEQSLEIVKEAAEAGIKKVWLQQGAYNMDVLARAADLGLDITAGKCIMMYAEPVKSVHKVHQMINKLFRKY